MMSERLPGTLAKKFKQAKRSDAVLRGAVPKQSAVPQLIDEIETAAEHRSVQFASITANNATSGGASAVPSSQLPPEVDGMKPVEFSFIFAGGFFEFERLVGRLTALTHSTRSPGRCPSAGVFS